MKKSDYRKWVYETLNQKGFFAKKNLSQNFLMDENIINNIITKAEIDKYTGVIEVGPGLGALTKDIIPMAKKALIYEVDKELIPKLNDLFSDYDNFTIVNKDFLKADLDQDIKGYLDSCDRIVLISNLPYHITTPIIMKVLEESNSVDSLVLMMQYEVAKRITSTPNSKDYNALSIIIQHQTKAEFLFKVPKTVFNPMPKVDSAVIKLKINRQIMDYDTDYKDFYRFVHNAFVQRRKTFINNITNAYSNITKETAAVLLNKHNLDEKIRSEAIKLGDFESLYVDFAKIIVEENKNGVK